MCCLGEIYGKLDYDPVNLRKVRKESIQCHIALTLIFAAASAACIYGVKHLDSVPVTYNATEAIGAVVVGAGLMPILTIVTIIDGCLQIKEIQKRLALRRNS